MTRQREQELANEREISRKGLEKTILTSFAVFFAIAAALVYTIIKARQPLLPGTAPPSPTITTVLPQESVGGSRVVEAPQRSVVDDVLDDIKAKAPKPSNKRKYEDEEALVIENAIAWLTASLEKFARNEVLDQERRDMDIGAVAELFQTLDSDEPNERPRIQQGIRYLQQIYGDVDREMVGTYINNLGVYFSYVRRDESNVQSLYYYESIAILEEALRVRREHFNHKIHPDIAQSLNNIAVIMQLNGKDLDRAQELGKGSYEIYKRTLGEDHPTTIQRKQDWIDAR